MDVRLVSSHYLFMLQRAYEWLQTKVFEMSPGRRGGNLKNVIMEHMLWIKFMSTPWEIVWMPQNTFDDMSTLIQVMAWCRQTTNHCLRQCWLKFMSPYGVTESAQISVHIIVFHNRQCVAPNNGAGRVYTYTTGVMTGCPQCSAGCMKWNLIWRYDVITWIHFPLHWPLFPAQWTSNAELWRFLWYTPEQTVVQKV